MESCFRAQIVGHPLQPLEKIQPQQPESADKHKDNNGQNDRRAFDGLEWHAIGLNKKPAQLKAALAFFQVLTIVEEIVEEE
jgi:hypothetical protein